MLGSFMVYVDDYVAFQNKLVVSPNVIIIKSNQIVDFQVKFVLISIQINW
jgi:hypothetical protein